MNVTITFDDGSTVSVPPDVKEIDEVELTNRNGQKSKTTWGSVIAHTNGEALELFAKAKPSSWLDNINDRISKDVGGNKQ